MDKVQSITDYDYCLVHLLEESSDYLDFFLKAKSNGRKIIMDCSLFELGEAFDSQKYYNWLLKIQPDEYIVPDVWQNCDLNLKSFTNFVEKFDLSALSGKKIGVLQGTSFEEFEKSCKFMVKNADKVAISFGYDFYLNNFSNEIESNFIQDVPRPQKLSLGRKRLFNHLYDNGFLTNDTPVHLLGCGTPHELIYYVRYSFQNVESVDTSHPVMTGYFKKSYIEEPDSFVDKVSQKMVDVFYEDVSDEQFEIIKSNIAYFKDMCTLR